MSPDLINSYLEIQKSADLSAATVFIQLLLPVPLPVLHPAFPDTFQESVSGSYLWYGN